MPLVKRLLISWVFVAPVLRHAIVVIGRTDAGLITVTEEGMNLTMSIINLDHDDSEFRIEDL